MDVTIRDFTATYLGQNRTVQVSVTGLAGFLLAKLAAAHGRQKAKDWYDIAFVLLYNDEGGLTPAIDSVKKVFPGVFDGAPGTWLRELDANFADGTSQGVMAFAERMIADHPDSVSIDHRSDGQQIMNQLVIRYQATGLRASYGRNVDANLK